MQSHQKDASSDFGEEHGKSPEQSDLASVSPNYSEGHGMSPKNSDHRTVLPELREEHEKTPNQSDSATVSFCLGKENEKYIMQSDSPTISPNLGEEHEENPDQSDSATDSPKLGDEHENFSKQSNPANDSLNLVEKHEKSPKRSDSACNLPIESKDLEKPDNPSDMEDSFKLIEEYQKAVKSVKKKHKRSFESARLESPNHNEEHQNSEKLSDLEDSIKLSEEYRKAVKSVKKKHKRSSEIADLARDNVSRESAGHPLKQLVLYEPSASGSEHDGLVAADDLESNNPFGNFTGPHYSSRVCPSIGSFTVQCATCFKWRLIPTKEKYEEIRETILQDPFTCERAREWRPDITCEDPTDISQDGTRVWAIDKPNIAQPPPGWERILRIRGEGGTRFADVYYAAPSGKKMRSMIEIQRYLLEHPKYVRQGVRLSQFSFQIPKPLHENYVRKRPARLMDGSDPGGLEFSKPLEPGEVNPLCWAPPPTRTELEAGGSDYSPSNRQTAGSSQLQKSSLPRRMKLKVSMPKPRYNNDLHDHPKVKFRS